MAKNRGKKFEDHFFDDWKLTVNDSWIFRLKDQMSGYKNSSKNPCDFVTFKSPIHMLVETKSTKASTFNIKFRQYPLLKEEYDKHITNNFVGVIIWFIKYDKIVYVPFETFLKLKEDGKKSFNVKYIDSKEYEFYDVPSEKLIKYMRSDYSGLIDYCRGNYERA